mgnify:CR=1 FL=1
MTTSTSPKKKSQGLLRDTYFVSPATGFAYLIDHEGRATRVAVEVEDYYEGPTCSICDGVGHGYPGGRPCPLEERGALD